MMWLTKLQDELCDTRRYAQLRQPSHATSRCAAVHSLTTNHMQTRRIPIAHTQTWPMVKRHDEHDPSDDVTNQHARMCIRIRLELGKALFN